MEKGKENGEWKENKNSAEGKMTAISQAISEAISESKGSERTTGKGEEGRKFRERTAVEEKKENCAHLQILHVVPVQERIAVQVRAARGL